MAKANKPAVTVARDWGIRAADDVGRRADCDSDWENPLWVEELIEGFSDRVHELVDLDAEDRVNA